MSPPSSAITASSMRCHDPAHHSHPRANAMLAGSCDPRLSSGGQNTGHGTRFALGDQHPSPYARPTEPCSTVFVTKGKKMRTSKNPTQKQPRFVLSMREGQITYTCRRCQHHCHHPKAIVRHLQVCQAH
jgi:hypothetical protein